MNVKDKFYVPRNKKDVPIKDDKLSQRSPSYMDDTVSITVNKCNDTWHSSICCKESNNAEDWIKRQFLDWCPSKLPNFPPYETFEFEPVLKQCGVPRQMTNCLSHELHSCHSSDVVNALSLGKKNSDDQHIVETPKDCDFCKGTPIQDSTSKTPLPKHKQKTSRESGAQSEFGSKSKPKLEVSYVEIIANAILSDSTGRLLLGDIYKYVEKYHPNLCTKLTSAWKNSIRHNLSINDCFIKDGKSVSGRGCFWSVHPACKSDFKRGDFNRLRARARVQQYNKQEVSTAKEIQSLMALNGVGSIVAHHEPNRFFVFNV